MPKVICVTCRRKMGPDFSGVIHYVKGKAICPECWNGASTDRKVIAEEKDNVEKSPLVEKQSEAKDEAKKAEKTAVSEREVEKKVKEDLEVEAAEEEKKEAGEKFVYF